MGSRPAKAGGSSGDASGPNGSEGDLSTDRPQAQQQPEGQQPHGEELTKLRAENERMASQVAALKEELNKEIKLNAALQTDVSRRDQTVFLTIAAALTAAAALATLVYKRR